MPDLLSRPAPLKVDPAQKHAANVEKSPIPSFARHLRNHRLTLDRRDPRVLQINVGKLCNLTCVHCHVSAGPRRREIITRETLERILDWLESSSIQTVDLTGGAPEMIPDFRWLIARIREMGRRVIDRCNLTILVEPSYEHIAAFLADHEVEVVASMPCYCPENVNAQRGEGVFDRSIEGLHQLNRVGYGTGPRLQLNLVYNPNGAKLPPDQNELQEDYRRELRLHFGIEFNQLYTLTNLPVARFATWLVRNETLDTYMALLLDAFNPASVEGLMCRDTISVDWEGAVFDCDFNQQLGLHLRERGTRLNLWNVDLATWGQIPIRTGKHCYGCTAGNGSSCGGALT